MKFIVGKKIGMTQIFKEDGTVVPVTLVKAEPNIVTQLKTKDKDGYEAVQIGYGKKRSVKKPQKKTGDFAGLREFKNDGELKIGDKIDVTVFSEGDNVKVSGTTKGKGFQGVVKRHGFHGAPASHGHHNVLRHGGSIGQRFPQHTLKGMRMAGHMGAERVTVSNLKIIKIIPEKNLMAISGAIPGHRGSLVEVRG